MTAIAEKENAIEHENKFLLTIDIGSVPQRDKLMKLHEGQYFVCPEAQGMLKRLRVAPVRLGGRLVTLANIIAVSMQDLGLPDGGTFHEAYVNGLAKGLRLCPGYFALLISKEYNRHEDGRRLYVAMTAVVHGSYSSVFVLEYDHQAGNHKSLSSSYSDHVSHRHHNPTRLDGNDVLLFWQEP